MKYQNEYRDSDIARKLITNLHKTIKKPIRIMEICGTHTVSIFRHGLRTVLPEDLKLISGPGCPVCVTATKDINKAIQLARIKNVHIATFGDLIRVPGTHSSLKKEMAEGARASIVYSTMDAIELAKNNPDDEIVFIGIGFETTAPTIAASILTAHQMKLENFSVLSAHKLLPPAMNALLTGGESIIDGFLCPGHVTTIIGVQAYRDVARNYNVPSVVAGFEPVDILQSLNMLLEFINHENPQVAIQYARAVSENGNPRARKIMDTVFEPADATWRGLGPIPFSGLAIKSDFSDFDAETRFNLVEVEAEDPAGCRCGDVLRGIMSPPECGLYKKVCKPDNPVGPCMVSSEGTCAAYYRYYSQ